MPARGGDRLPLVFMDESGFHEGVLANFKGVISACQVSPLVKYGEFSSGRRQFVHRRLGELGDDKGYLVLGLFGNPTNWFGADGTGTPPLSQLIPDLRPLLDRHRGLQLLIDYSWEAGLGEGFFSGMDAFLRDIGVDPGRVVVLVSNQGIEERLVRYLRAQKREASRCFRVIGADLWLMYSAVELQRKHWYGAPETLVLETEIEARCRTLRPRKFLSFNRRPRWQRFLFALMVGRLGLERQAFISMSSPEYRGDWVPEDSRIDEYGALMSGDRWRALKSVRERVFASLPWTIDINMDAHSGRPEAYLYHTQDRQLFLDSYSQVITESYMEGEPVDVFITEKTCRALGNLQPFLVFGHSGMLRRLRQHGFESSAFFDDTYDGIVDLGERLDRLYDAMEELSAASIRDLHERYHADLDVLRFNRRRLFEMPEVLAERVAARLHAELWA
ncbi:MAG: hypothetical protein JO264_08680 [Acidisphaera sp.]|nr:hypothetical protein [Acidisphaera sp.]